MSYDVGKATEVLENSCDVCEVTEILENELSEELVTKEKRKKCWGMNCDVGEATEGLENEL